MEHNQNYAIDLNANEVENEFYSQLCSLFGYFFVFQFSVDFVC